MYIVLCSKSCAFMSRALCGCLYLHHSAVVPVLRAVVGVGIVIGLCMLQHDHQYAQLLLTGEKMTSLAPQV
jgi:hypothetical protein